MLTFTTSKNPATGGGGFRAFTCVIILDNRPIDNFIVCQKATTVFPYTTTLVFVSTPCQSSEELSLTGNRAINY